MKNLFPVNELVNADPCDDGLDRVTRSLCTYSGLTVVTVDALEHATASDICWGLHLLPISEHAQKVIAVKVAVYAAEQVAHLTNDPRAAECVSAAKNWLVNPCEETTDAARAAARAARDEAAWAATRAAAEAAWAAARATTGAARAAAERAAAAATWAEAKAGVAESIKTYAVQLIREA